MESESLVKKKFPGQDTKLDARSIELRRTIIKVLAKCGRAHLGSALSLVEIIRVLYDNILHVDPANPRWIHRDRFILSKGHGCLALYVMLADKGFFPEEVLWTFCSKDSILGGHPEFGKIPGVEASTGSLGHGLPIGIGMALTLRHDKSDSRVFVVIGDGESNEGSVWEGALSASKHKLSNLTVVIDYNKHQSYGPTSEVLELEPYADKWRAFGFTVAEVDGHSVNDLRKVLKQVPLDANKPTAIICHTIKGKGIPVMENNMAWHHVNKITEEQVKQFMQSLEEYSK